MTRPGNDPATEWHAAYERVCALVDEAAGGGLEVSVPATPDWTARDLLAHVVGLGHDVVAGAEPDDHDPAWTASHVEQRRGRSGAEMLAEWAADHDAIVECVRADPRPLGDVIIHEQDLRGALERPGARQSDGLRFVRESIASRLASSVEGRSPIRLEAPDWSWQTGEGDPGVVLRASGFDLFRAVTSRRSAEELRAWVVAGDLESYLDAFAVLGPLPERSLGG